MANVSPEAGIRAEIKTRAHGALELMDPIDREVLTVRHFEQLTISETALELRGSEEATKKRHRRAQKRLKLTLTGVNDSAQQDRQ